MLLACNHGKNKEKEEKLNQKEYKCKIKLSKEVGLDVCIFQMLTTKDNYAS
jgi:hypothetical protein